jgi:NADPH:quinone reductase-like Zn-dependent oxidoreductase
VQWRQEFQLAAADDPGTDYAERTVTFADAVEQIRERAYGWQRALDSVRITQAARANTDVGADGTGVTVEYLTEASIALPALVLRRANAAGRYGIEAALAELDLLHDQLERHRDDIGNGNGDIDAGYGQPRVTVTLEALIDAVERARAEGRAVVPKGNG